VSEVEEKQEAETDSDIEKAMQDAVQSMENREKPPSDDDDEEGIDLLGGEESSSKPEKKDAASAVTESLIAAKKELEDALEQTRTQYKELRAKWMRAAADLDNYKKRAKRERAEAVKFGNERLIKDLLPVFDDLDRTLNVMDAGETEVDAQSLLDGIRMVHKKFLAQLEKHEVVSFESKAKPFDPAQHEAVHQMHSDEIEAGGVLDEMQRGFFLSGRLLRPSLVTVSLGAEQASEDQSQREAENDSGEQEQNGEQASNPVDDAADADAENTESGE
jgi:molecular chaperone GrpE